MWQQREVRERVAATERLLADLAARRDTPGGAVGVAAVQALVDLYGQALERIMAAADAGTTDALLADELVTHLLLVHDLHPHDPATRIGAALADLSPRAAAELVAVDGTVATVRLAGGGCHVTEARTAVVDTVLAAAPEVTEVRVDLQAPASTAFVPLSTVRAR